MNRIYEARIVSGLIFITATIILVGWIAINENARMEEFTERSTGRAVENGARIFEANCSSCHGVDGRGLAGVAPALNNPMLFGYNYLADLDSELAAVNAQLEAETDADARAGLQGRVAELEAERTARIETILYDWSDVVGTGDAAACADRDQNVNPALGYSEAQLCEVGTLGVQLNALDTQIEELEGIESADDLSIHISRREAEELAPLMQERDDLQTKFDASQAAENPGPELTAEEQERLAAVQEEIALLEADLKPYSDAQNQRQGINDRIARFQAVMDAHNQVVAAREQLAEAESALAALGEAPEDGADPNASERETLTASADEASTLLDSAEGARADAYQALLDNNEILFYNPNSTDSDGALTPANYNRLAQVSWTGTLYDFIEGTITSGRPTSASYWPNPMAAWSQTAGGPLRGDQVRNLTEFILNWNREFTVEDLRAVRQFARIPGETATGGDVFEDTVGTNAENILAELTAGRDAGEIAGDPAAGQTLFTELGCAGCHGQVNGAGPAVVGLWTRAQTNQDDRLTQTGFTDNPEGYLVHSIVNPHDFLVPGFGAVMPNNFGGRLTLEDLNNILAYLETQE